MAAQSPIEKALAERTARVANLGRMLRLANVLHASAGYLIEEACFRIYAADDDDRPQPSDAPLAEVVKEARENLETLIALCRALGVEGC